MKYYYNGKRVRLNSKDVPKDIMDEYIKEYRKKEETLLTTFKFILIFIPCINISLFTSIIKEYSMFYAVLFGILNFILFGYFLWKFGVDERND